MFDFKKLTETKKLIKLDCRLSFTDQKKITKEQIEQKVAYHLDEKFPNYINRRKLFLEIRDEVLELFFTSEGNIAGVSDQQDHIRWFNRNRIDNKPFWEVYRQYLIDEGKVPLQSINDLDKYTDLILSDIEDPNRLGNWDRRGMVVGSVQSGKTSNYLGLIAKARDAGYKFIVILSGANNDLRQQTQQRVDENYIGIKTYEKFKRNANDYNKLGRLRYETFRGQYQIPTSGTIDIISGDLNKIRTEGLPKKIIQKEDYESYVFIIKKNRTPLTNLIEWLTKHPQCYNKDGAAGFEKFPAKNTLKPPFIKDFPLLLIDDECDHYSIDTDKPPRDLDGKFDDEYDPTKINGLIRKLLQCFSRRIYIGYTATPFANILVHDEKNHKNYGEDIFPKSFIYDIEPAPNHQGLETIFGKEQEDDGVASQELSSFLVPINDFCKEPNNLFCKEGWFPPKHKSDHVPIYNSKEDPIDNNIDEKTLNFYLKLIEISKNKFNKDINLPPSLIHAIISFIIACSVRNIRSDQGIYSHKSMLIHVTKFVKPQQILTDDIITFFNSLLECLKEDNEYKDIFHQSLKYIYETYFMRYTNEYSNSKVQTITYDAILLNESGLKFCVSEISRNIVTMSGGTSKPNYEEYREEKQCGLMTIIIGGDKLSRGVTFDGLSTTYFLRSSRMFDTLMQMGRWFGYRSGYNDLCRLYTSSDLLDAFEKISIASREVRSEIRRMRKLGKSPKEFGLWIASSPYSHYIPTARNKMRHSVNHFVNYSLWGNQMPTMSWEKDKVLKNFNLTSDFLKQLGNPNEKNIIRNYGINKTKKNKKIIQKEFKINAENAYYWKDVNYKSVIYFLKEFIAHESSGFQPQEMSNYIKKAVEKKNMLTNWNVALMGNGSSGIKPNIGGYEVNLAFRKPKNTFTSDKASYGVIWDPIHEAIDIDPKKYREANAEFYSNIEESDNTQFTKILRQKRSNTNGLILIYPILPINFNSVPRIGNKSDPMEDFDDSWENLKKNFHSENKGNIKKEIEERKGLISIAISFPETSEDLATHIIVNNTYSRISEQEQGEEDY